eukprot:TRINITY_DN25864_c1_g1_i3.p6 TRINITY_DN25864_c1_g1~~TRINITY_DN25864_c1_g1_i3.p6  ORF type:complete len:149 (+),score=3.84 TRINITY_DN25864_c1_g1_i3:1672-2118(+)
MDAKKNPGISGCGMVLLDYVRHTLAFAFQFLGLQQTNNEAEFSGLLLGLNVAKDNALSKIIILGDSQLVINALCSHCLITSKRLIPSFVRIKRLLQIFQVEGIYHINRHENQHADSLANQAIQLQTSLIQVNYEKLQERLLRIQSSQG